MKKYRVTVNGTVYEVELEELTGSAPVSAPAAPAAAPAPAASAAPAAGEQICAPMPGNILAVNVTAGQAVKKGDMLMVLEAMKMENEIMCPRDGVVASVNTSFSCKKNHSIITRSKKAIVCRAELPHVIWEAMEYGKLRDCRH